MAAQNVQVLMNLRSTKASKLFRANWMIWKLTNSNLFKAGVRILLDDNQIQQKTS